MSKWLYDPEMDSRNGKEFEYNSPIHENDTLFNGLHIENTCVVYRCM